MRFIELFCGIGGFRLGLEKANIPKQESGEVRQTPSIIAGSRNWRGIQSIYRCVWANDIDRYACQIYRKHWGDVHEGDIRAVDADGIPDHDLLCAGFPCQSFSIAGKRGGFEDTRGTLFFEIGRVLRAKRPRYVLLENVKGLLSHDDGATFETILGTLDELGYDCQWEVLNSKDWVPQNRERVFIIGHLRGQPRPQVFPLEGIYKEDNQLARETLGQNRSWSGALRESGTSSFGSGDVFVANEARIRRLTPTECERLQGFPDGWTEGISDTQRYKCLGNAVTVDVIEAIGRQLLEWIKRNGKVC